MHQSQETEFGGFFVHTGEVKSKKQDKDAEKEKEGKEKGKSRDSDSGEKKSKKRFGKHTLGCLCVIVYIPRPRQTLC
jgi:hypothetical protein